MPSHVGSSNQGIETRGSWTCATAARMRLTAPRRCIGDRGLAVTSDLQAAEVTGDRVLLERMIGNLVDNAVRHNTDGGRIHLRSGSRNGHVFVEVANSGLLVAQDQVPALFEPFRRAGGGGRARGPGSGSPSSSRWRPHTTPRSRLTAWPRAASRSRWSCPVGRTGRTSQSACSVIQFSR